ncbi:hypothetical protein K1719_034707 [Acacia pycnantha]|nr:hypothetical protein K1719_034707 [Acacia pycnantha]
MEGNHDRSWMYNRLTDRRELTQAFLAGLEEFIQFALANSNNSSREIREICASEINVEKLRHLEASMPITLCKLEMIFPPSLFDSMEHLPVHLAYEAKVGGPQQYRWMYPFERFLRTLKHKIKNPRYVEGSIAEAYLVEEAAKFASYYYPPEMMSRWRGYFSYSVRSANPSMSGSEDDQFTNSEFPKWLRSYFVENPSDPNEVAWSLSYGAAISVTGARNT